jgi:hypothetical protein
MRPSRIRKKNTVFKDLARDQIQALNPELVNSGNVDGVEEEARDIGDKEQKIIARLVG